MCSSGFTTSKSADAMTSAALASTLSGDLKPQLAGPVDLGPQPDRLDVQKYLRYLLPDVRYGLVLVLDTLDPNGRDRRAFESVVQDAAHGIADRDAVAGLQAAR